MTVHSSNGKILKKTLQNTLANFNIVMIIIIFFIYYKNNLLILT